MKFIGVIAAAALVLVEAQKGASKNARRCSACHQLQTAISDGLKQTQHEEGMVEDTGRLDSGGRHGKGSRKVAYGTSEARLVKILEKACGSNDNKPECYELVEDEKYYEPIKKWFTSGRKQPFLQAICYTLIPGCTPAAIEKTGSDKGPGSTQASGWEQRLIGMLPEQYRDAPFVQKLLPWVRKAQQQADQLTVMGGEYGKIALKNVRVASEAALANANMALDKLPIREYVIDKLPLNTKQANFVEQHWKVIMVSIFLALFIPLYCLTCKSTCRKTVHVPTRSSSRTPLAKTRGQKKTE